MIEISKELLSEVLDYDVDKYTIVSSTEITQIRAWKKDAEMWDYRSYDIYHLSHKCKEWAESNGYYTMSGTWALQDGKQKACIIGKPKPLENFIAETEVEAIIKACEWILSKIKEGN